MPVAWRHALVIPVGILPLLAAASAVGEAPTGDARTESGRVQVMNEVHHDTSPPLWSIPPAPRSGIREYEAPRPVPRPHSDPRQVDRALQAQAAEALAPTALASFDGIGNGVAGFAVNSAPPDTNGDVGPNHYVETVNTDFAVFDKSGAPLYGPVPINTLWSGFGGGCQTNNDGDPVVLYDPIADRWLISQFSVSTTPFLQCLAVSQTPDPTGTYNRYSFSYSNFPDYPKFGVWPDAYYATFNMFNASGTAFLGSQVCAYDRAKMLAGQAATQQCFDTGTSFGGLLPADLDGSRLPPAGSPNPVVALGASANQLAFWRFHVDWTTPANTTFTGPTTLATAAFSEACAGGTCIPQSGTSQKLDSLADRLMYRLAYRNFGDHESLVVNHSVVAGSSVGVRWYELRLAGGTASIFQQGTYAPDSNYRWMGSIVQDQVGDMALGFSLSSSTLHPEIHYTGRLAGDAAGQMTQGEGTLIDGPGSQTGGLSRWGDYSMMAVDPSDDCTFWYVNEYIPANGSFNWKTRIGSFKFPDCGSAPPSDFSIAVSPTGASVSQGGSTTAAVSTAVTSGSAETVSLSITGAPAGVTPSLSPTSVTAGAGSTLTLTVDAATTPGSYTLTVTGTSPSATHSATYALTVVAAPANDFSIAVSPSSASAAPGGSATATITTAVTSGSTQSVALSVGGTPAGTTASASPSSVTAGGSSTLTVNVGAATAPGTYTLTITGTGSSATHSASFTLTVLAPPPPNDFSIAVSPTSASAAPGGSATATITTAVTSGSAQTVALSLSGAPTGVTASASPSSVTAGGSSTLTATVDVATAPGTYTLTITGTGTSATHTASFSLTVTGTGIVNGGFESGLTGWTSSGSTAISTSPHSGAQAAQVGSVNPSGDSSLSQTFTVPAAGGTLSLWYKVVCTDTVTYDWATVTLRDNTTGVPSTVLPRTCTNNGTWRQATAALPAGHSMTLTLSDHDDNYPGDPTYTLYDDVAIVTSVPNPLQNGGFESGLTSWTASGSTGTSTIAHSGTASARVGSTSPTLNSSLVQTFTVPAAGGTLSFWYRMTCPDTLTYDWATVTLRDNATALTRTLLPRTCTNSGLWVQVSASVASSAGHSVTLTLANHDDNYPADPSFTLYDDVVIQ